MLQNLSDDIFLKAKSRTKQFVGAISNPNQLDKLVQLTGFKAQPFKTILVTKLRGNHQNRETDS